MVEQSDYSSFSIGVWQVSAGTCTLSREGSDVKITPRSMDVLVYLARKSGKVISSKELLDNLWEVATSDHAVHKAIAELRNALGDDAQHQQFIRTVPRRGYSLLVKPQWPGQAPEPASTVAKLTRNLQARQLRWSGVALALAILVLLAVQQGGVRRGEGVGAGQDLVTLGILPFEGDLASNRFLVDGMTASLLSGLSKLSQLGVIPLPHDEQYTLNRRSAQSLGEELGVDHLLDGTLLQADGQQRLVVHLVRTADGMQMYSEQFDLPAQDIFTVQDAIVSNIITALSIHLDDRQRSDMLDWGTTNALAFEQFLKGEFYNNQFNPQDFEKAIQHHQAAIKLDPGFINAYLGVVTAANNLAVYSRIEKIEKLRQLVADMHRAVASIDRNSPALESIRAIELRMSGGNYRQEEEQLRQQILSGNPPEFALGHYALFLIGARMFDEARQFLDLAAEAGPFDISPDEIWSYRLDILTPEAEANDRRRQLQERPNHIGILGTMARNLMFTGDYEEALAFARRQRELDSEEISAHFTEVVTGALTGRLHHGSPELDSHYNKGQDFHFNNGVLAFMLGDVDTGAKFWRSLRPVQKRRLVNIVYASEKFFPDQVLDSPDYQALLEELDVGISWQRTLMEGVMAMESVTGISLSEKSRAAYENQEFMGRNNLWTEDQWQTLALQLQAARQRQLF
jgi:DNA-binding winged helix-turn-helix (wHTH) protein/TolB-like protein